MSRITIATQYVTNSGNQQNPKFTTTQSKEIITQPQKQFSQKELPLLQRHCGLKQLPQGKITRYKELGSGGQGTVYAGTLKTNGKITHIIIKESHADDIEYGTQVSSDLISKAKENLAKDYNLISSQEGFANVVFQQEINGQHIQKRVKGVNGFEAIYNKEINLYDTKTGHPKNIHQPLILAQRLLNGVHAIHEQGKIHSDLKPENIMLEQTKKTITLDDGRAKKIKERNPKIIDLGLAADTGKSIIGYSSNAAPEVRNNFVATATTAMDIFTAGTVLCELLFGKNSKKWKQCFCSTLGRNNKLQSSIYQRHGNPEQYLRNLLQEANKLPKGKELYPPAIYQAIEDLIVRMCAIEPEDRPSAQYCLAVLNDLALCAEAINQYEKLKKLEAEKNLSDEGKKLLTQLKTANKKFQKEKPMVVGTISQATQLISDLNKLNKKAELTPKEKEIKEVLLYNLGRDFEIESYVKRLIISYCIKMFRSNKTLNKEQADKLSKLYKINVQIEMLYGLKDKLSMIDKLQKTTELLKKIGTAIKKLNSEKLLDQKEMEKLEVATEKIIIMHCLNIDPKAGSIGATNILIKSLEQILQELKAAQKTN